MRAKSRAIFDTISGKSGRVQVDARLPVPLYHQIFLALRDKIHTGEFRDGSFLPGEFEIASSFGVSRITAKRALDEIAAAGLAVRQQGRGTVVSLAHGRTAVRGSVESLIHSLRRSPLRSSVSLLEFRYLPAPADVAVKLLLPPGASVQMAVRVCTASEGPVSQLITYVPAEVGRRWTARDLKRQPLISLLERSGIEIASAQEHVTATLADKIAAHRLDVAIGAPLLKISRTVFDQADRAVEYLTGLYPAERYQYSVSLGRESVGDYRNASLGEFTTRGE